MVLPSEEVCWHFGHSNLSANSPLVFFCGLIVLDSLWEPEYLSVRSSTNPWLLVFFPFMMT